MHARGKVAYIHPVCLPLKRKGPSNLAAKQLSMPPKLRIPAPLPHLTLCKAMCSFLFPKNSSYIVSTRTR